MSVSTLESLGSIAKAAEELKSKLSGANSEAEEMAAALGGSRTRDIAYNPTVPIEKFDFIITDECHRSVYNLWRQLLEYFDGFFVGLTATPAPQTLAYFHQNRVAEYNHGGVAQTVPKECAKTPPFLLPHPLVDAGLTCAVFDEEQQTACDCQILQEMDRLALVSEIAVRD